MRILFDQNVPRPLASYLVGHEITRSAVLHWEELRNGDLLDAAEEHGFELLVTADRNLGYQQNLRERKLAIVVLPSGQWPELQPMLSSVCAAIDAAQPGTFLQLPPARTGRA